MLKTVLIALAFIVLFTSCASTTIIYSHPTEAKLYLDEVHVGKTPYKLRDSKIILTCIDLRIEKEGYETFTDEICKDESLNVGPLIGGIFLFIPYLWVAGYDPVNTFTLTPINEESSKPVSDNIDTQKGEKNNQTKAEKLRELKALLDEGVLTEEEYKNEKTKILDK